MDRSERVMAIIKIVLSLPLLILFVLVMLILVIVDWFFGD